MVVVVSGKLCVDVDAFCFDDFGYLDHDFYLFFFTRRIRRVLMLYSLMREAAVVFTDDMADGTLGGRGGG